MKKSGWLLMIAGLFWAGALHAETLNLSDCLELARQRNPTLKSAAFQPAIAEENVAKARSGYLPRADLTAGYTWQQDPQAIAILGQEIPVQDPNYAHAAFQVEQTLYDFGRTGSRLAGAKAGEDAVRYRLAGLEQDIFLRTVVAYFRVLEEQQLFRAAEQEVAQRTDHLQRARILYEQGAVTRNDVLQAEVELATSRQLQLSRSNAVENSWLELNYLTGRPPESRGQLAEESMAPPVFPPAPEKAVESRPELAAQRSLIAATEEDVNLARAEYRPRLFIRGTADYVENSHYEEQTIYAATVGFSINLFDGLATTAEYRQALKRRAEEQQTLADLQQRAALEYRAAENDSNVARQRIEVAREAIRQGEENLRINRSRYQEQVGTATEVIDAQTLLTRARTDYHRAVFEYDVALARLRRAAGTL
jgi:outer membrane protein